MLVATWKKNDARAKWLIGIFSVVVFVVVALLTKIQLHVSLPFDVHFFALANAVINSIVALLLLIALVAVKLKKFLLHKKIMLTAMVLSILFLVSYIAHHLLAGETKFGDIDHNGIVTEMERLRAGSLRGFYFFILLTHIPLAIVILPFILFTAYRALIGEYERHKKIARITWPIWFYVAITGVVVYMMISPYY